MFVFLDLETTGLDESACEILEIGVAVVDPTLTTLSARSWVVRPSRPICKELLHPTVVEMHTKNGLFQDIEEGDGREREEVELEVRAFLDASGLVSPPVCGSSVHFDRRFLARYMPKVEKFFGYRNIDVSTITELAKVWFPEVGQARKKPATDHRVLTDIENSVDLLRYYRVLFFDRLREVLSAED